MTYKNIYNNAWCRTSSIFHDKLDNDNDLRQPLPLATSLYSQYKLVVFLVGFQHNRLMAFISPAALLMITIPPPQDGHHCEWYIFLSIQSWWWWTASYPPCSCQCMSIKAQASSIVETSGLSTFISHFLTASDKEHKTAHGWKLHMLKEMTSILFAVALFGVACHLANWGLQVIVAPFVTSWIAHWPAP